MRELRKLLPTLLAISPFLILPLAIEGGVRFALPHIPTIKFYVSGYTHADNEDGAKIFEGDPLLGWRMKANLNRVWWEFTTFSTDNRHMRIPSEVQRNSGRRFRIVCLGNSVTFGYRVPVSFREAPQDFDHRAQPFPALLQERLLAEHPGQSIEVISMAVPGYSTYHGLNWLRREIGWLDPDLVVVHFGFNDSLLLPQEYEEAFPNEWYRVVARWAVAQSQAAIHFSRWFGAKISSPNPGGQIKLRPGVSSEDYVRNILSIAHLARENGAQTLVLGQVFQKPDPDSQHQILMQENRRLLSIACFKENVTYLEIRELTEKGYPTNQNLFGEPIHPNKFGHQLMADRIYECIGYNNMFSDLKIETR
jgi:lysophospholipase L1-like esterase